MSGYAWAWVGLGAYWLVVIALFFSYAYSRPIDPWNESR